MPVRAGRRICQLISQTLLPHVGPPALSRTHTPLALRCLTASAIAAAPRPKRKRPRPPQPPKSKLLRDQLRALLKTPTDDNTIEKLSQLKHTLPTTPEQITLLAEVLAHHVYVADALELLSRARAQGVLIPPAYYEPIAFRLAHQNRWHDVLALLEPIQNLHVPSTNKLTTRLCEWRVRACAELGDFAGMERALGKFPHGIPHRAWEIAERACLRNSDPETANRIRQVLKIDGKFKEKGKGKEVEWKTTEEIVRLLVWKPNARGDSSGVSSRAVRISRMDNSNDPTYLITSHTTPSSSNNPPISHSFRPGSRIAALCVQDLVRGGRVKEAATLVASMCKGALVPETPSAAAASTSDSKSAPNSAPGTLPLSEVFVCVKPDIFVFNALLRGVLDTRGLAGMLLLLEIMQEQSVAPNAETGVLLLRYLDRQLAWRPYRLIETLVDLTKPIPKVPGGDRSMPPKPKPVPISVRHTNILLSSILHAERSATLGGGWKASAAFLKYRTRPVDRWPPSDAHLGSSPKTDPPTAGLGFRSRTAHLGRVVQALRTQGVRNDPMAYALRAQRDGVIRLDPETARNVLQSADFPLGEYHYAALMAGLTECGYMDAAASVMRAAHYAGFGAKEPVMHTILVSGYGRIGLPREAERVFGEMREKEIVPDAIAVDALAGAWFVSGDYPRAREVVLKHWPGKGDPPCGREASLRNLVVELRKLRPNSKVRRKRVGDVTEKELRIVERIVEAIKTPDKVLPSPLANEKKDASKSNTRKFSSIAGAGDGMNDDDSEPVSLDARGSSDRADKGKSRLEQPVVHGRKLKPRVRALSALQ